MVQQGEQGKRFMARVVSHSISSQWASIRFHPLICTYAPCVDGLAKSRNIPTCKMLPLFFVSRPTRPRATCARACGCGLHGGHSRRRQPRRHRHPDRPVYYSSQKRGTASSVCERFQVLDKILLASPRVLGARVWALAHVRRGERTRFDRRSRKAGRLFLGRTNISLSFFSVAGEASSL